MSDTIKVILALSALYGAVFIILGFKFGGEYKDFFLNIGTELFGIFITVFAIEYIYRREEKKVAQEKEKKRLIRILATGSREGVGEALDHLRARGWLSDGSIKGERFSDRDFSELDFRKAKFVNCFFHEVNFNGANLNAAIFEGGSMITGVKFENTDLGLVNFEGFSFLVGTLYLTNFQPYLLSKAKRLRFAIMPDGKRYDGRYRLPGDLQYFRFHETQGIAEKMAEFYYVTLEEYLAGQEWADKNLAKYKDS